MARVVSVEQEGVLSSAEVDVVVGLLLWLPVNWDMSRNRNELSDWKCGRTGAPLGVSCVATDDDDMAAGELEKGEEVGMVALKIEGSSVIETEEASGFFCAGGQGETKERRNQSLNS